MIPVIITALICVTTVIIVRTNLTITIKHVSTTEISESMIEYQQILNEAKPEETVQNDEEIETIDSVVSAISNIFEGDDD